MNSLACQNRPGDFTVWDREYQQRRPFASGLNSSPATGFQVSFAGPDSSRHALTATVCHLNYCWRLQSLSAHALPGSRGVSAATAAAQGALGAGDGVAEPSNFHASRAARQSLGL
eukprot:4358339-Pleurochrysis_carterae.AAC.4